MINQHVFESLAFNARIALHVRTLYGRDPHHITEAEYKALRAHSAKRSNSTHASRACRRPKARCDNDVRRCARLRSGNCGRRNVHSSGSAPRSRSPRIRAAATADGLVVPGVGAFEACMTGLREIGGEKIIAERLAAGRPVLGVCVGMQILFARGVEFGVESLGCGQWPGAVSGWTRR